MDGNEGAGVSRTPTLAWPEGKKQSFGQHLVGVSFNPSNNADVDRIKWATAAIIDDLYILSQDRNHPGARNASIAITHFEDAAMFGVKAYTKQPWE